MASICDSCIRNIGIRAFIAEQEKRGRCKFCRQPSKKGHIADLADVIEFVWDRVSQDYEDPANSLPYDSAEGGYQGATVYTSRQLLTEQIELDLAPEHHEAIVDAIIESSGEDAWCHRNPFGLSVFETLHNSWEAFCEVVKWRTRFFFNQEGTTSEHSGESDDDDLASELMLPNKLLAVTAELIERRGLVRTVPSGLLLNRARQRGPNDVLNTAIALGPPPPERATTANRMNPPGIPVFYGAETEATAIVETIEPGKNYATGLFEALVPLRILDLGSEIDEPDYFELNSDDLQGLRFLRRFAEAIAVPVARDDRNHVEYVPTQIVAEHFRAVYRQGEGRIDGIRWKSSVGEHLAYVLFATRADLVLTNEEVGQLTERERRWRSGKQGWLKLRSSGTGKREQNPQATR